MVRKQDRAYLVCPCGGSWLYADRIGAQPLCTACGRAWKGLRAAHVAKAKPFAKAKAKWSDWAAPRQVRFDTEERWTRQEWQAWQAAQLATVGQPPGPPGLPPKPILKTPKPKVSAAAPAGAVGSLDPDVLRKLHSVGGLEVIGVLKEAGLQAPEPPPPSLEELCQQHMAALPEALQHALAEPVKVPSGLEVLQDNNRRYKALTAELRSLIQEKVSLQAKIDKTKALYATQLQDMQTLLAQLTSKQDEVLQCQAELKSQLDVPPAEELPGLADALKGAGLQVTDDQVQAVKANLLAASQPTPDNQMSDPTELLRAQLQEAQAQIQTLQAAAVSAASNAPEPPPAKKLKPGNTGSQENGSGDAQMDGVDAKHRSRSPKSRTQPSAPAAAVAKKDSDL